MNETPEPISEINELNVLREKTLRGEEVTAEEYGRVLLFVRKIRRAKSEPVEKPKRGKVDASAILSGIVPKA